MASLQKFLRDADERVRKACADALNEASQELEKQIKTNMSSKGIQNKTGRLRGSVTANKATEKKPVIVIKSEVYAPLPKNQSKNRRLWGKSSLKYPSKGVPYGRILEFSPRYKKYNNYFYGVWYKNRNKIREDVIKAIGNAWSGK